MYIYVYTCMYIYVYTSCIMCPSAGVTMRPLAEIYLLLVNQLVAYIKQNKVNTCQRLTEL